MQKINAKNLMLVAQDLLRDRADHLFGHDDQVPVVGVRHVELEHRELGVVAGGYPFIAEIAVDLIHPFNPPTSRRLR